jgi:hypothetical protein
MFCEEDGSLIKAGSGCHHGVQGGSCRSQFTDLSERHGNHYCNSRLGHSLGSLRGIFNRKENMRFKEKEQEIIKLILINYSNSKFGEVHDC